MAYLALPALVHLTPSLRFPQKTLWGIFGQQRHLLFVKGIVPGRAELGALPDGSLPGNRVHIQSLGTRFTAGHLSYTSRCVLATPQSSSVLFPVIAPPKQTPGAALLPAAPPPRLWGSLAHLLTPRGEAVLITP